MLISDTRFFKQSIYNEPPHHMVESKANMNLEPTETLL